MASAFLGTTPPHNKPASLHDSARASPEPLDGFDKLIRDINIVLGPSSGINSADVDVEELKTLMGHYSSNEAEWERYAFSDYSRAYTRNLVDNCNGKSNLLLIVWTPGKASPIHDHANAHCVMRILKGALTETIYGWPCERSDNPSECATVPSSEFPGTEHTCSSGGILEPAALHIKRETTYNVGQVAYMSDALGLHRVANASDSKVAMSLHLYTPPNAANHGCHIFEESTGKKSHVQQCRFFSEFGIKN